MGSGDGYTVRATVQILSAIVFNKIYEGKTDLISYVFKTQGQDIRGTVRHVSTGTVQLVAVLWINSGWGGHFTMIEPTPGPPFPSFHLYRDLGYHPSPAAP